MNDKNPSNTKLEIVAKDIKESNVYENSDSWSKRGLNKSDEEVIVLLRKVTNEFLDKAQVIEGSELSNTEKRSKIVKIVDELPWDELDTEEKEFMADVLAPAIQSMGYNPWRIF